MAEIRPRHRRRSEIQMRSRQRRTVCKTSSCCTPARSACRIRPAANSTSPRQLPPHMDAAFDCWASTSATRAIRSRRSRKRRENEARGSRRVRTTPAASLLNKGDAVGAERVLSPVIGQLGSDAKALHLMGLIKKRAGKLRRSRALLAQRRRAFLERGRLLQRSRRRAAGARRVRAKPSAIFRAASRWCPTAQPTRVNWCAAMLAAGEFAEAEAEARAYVAANPGAGSWTLLGQVQRAQEKNEERACSAEAALQFAPDIHAACSSTTPPRSIALGRAKEALEHLCSARPSKEHRLPGPRAQLRARTLRRRGKQEAEAVLEQGIKTWPIGRAARPLARMRWLRGAGEASTALIEAEIASVPTTRRCASPPPTHCIAASMRRESAPHSRRGAPRRARQSGVAHRRRHRAR